VRIAASKADLTDGSLLSSVGPTEGGTYLGSNAAWTGTDSAGQADPARCSDWVLADATMGRNGWADLANQLWTTKASLACSSTWLRLY